MTDKLTDFPTAEPVTDASGTEVTMARKQLNLLIEQARGRLESLEILRDSMKWDEMSAVKQSKMMTFFKMLR